MKSELTILFDRPTGPVRRLNAVNNGPVRGRSDQTCGNFDSYSATGFPYARTHDAAYCSAYGGPHTVDVTAVFPDFAADENDPASYDFCLTDEYIGAIAASGTGVFYRLGQSIEHWTKKYGTIPPRDFAKWARICEHIVRHLNEGWADGHRFGIEYWEIWNEPDLDPDDSPNKRCWGGTKAQFFDFFETAAKHLKAAFPALRIGGPALAGDRGWAADFLAEMSRRGVPLDFFSWHVYEKDPRRLAGLCSVYRELLDRNGYPDAESILDEWNYVRNWDTQWLYSLRAMTGIKGASFAAATLCLCQDRPVDMLMYYDARAHCGMNGLFDVLTLEPGKTYWPYLAFRDLAALCTAVRTESSDPTVFALASSDGAAAQILLTRYAEDDGTPGGDVQLSFSLARDCDVRFFLTDAAHDRALVREETLGPGRRGLCLPLKLFDVYQISVSPRA